MKKYLFRYSIFALLFSTPPAILVWEVCKDFQVRVPTLSPNHYNKNFTWVLPPILSLLRDKFAIKALIKSPPPPELELKIQLQIQKEQQKSIDFEK